VAAATDLQVLMILDLSLLFGIKCRVARRSCTSGWTADSCRSGSDADQLTKNLAVAWPQGVIPQGVKRRVAANILCIAKTEGMADERKGASRAGLAPVC
jgi:hypothetical protein